MKKSIEQANAAFQEILDEQIYVEEGAAKNVSEIQLEEANIRQKTEFAILRNLRTYPKRVRAVCRRDRKSKSGCRTFRRGCEEKTGRY